jgi:hypothetical protein
MLRGMHDGSEVELSGSADSLREFAARLAEANAATISLDSAVGASAYSDWINSISIEPLEAAHTRIGIQDRRLHIAGPTDQLRAIADNVHWLTINSPDTGSHLHMEYYDGHPFLEPGSIPLVITYE